MENQGPEFYDKKEVFETYINHRLSDTNPNITIEQPILWNLIGSPKGLDVLDLGCGDARVAETFRQLGANKYVGIEGSKLMCEQAQKNVDNKFSFVNQCWLEDWQEDPEQYDLVVSSLAFHYIEDLASLFEKVQKGLKPQGRFIFSVEHPVITSSNEALKSTSLRQSWIVDNYFVRGKRVIDWMGDKVCIYHRTIEDYFHEFQKTGFNFVRLKESEPQKHLIEDEALLARRKRIPLFLFFELVK